MIRERADLILVNTCSIREKAAQKIYSQLGRFRELKEKNPRLSIGVGGCLAQQWGDRFFRRVPYLDLVFGTHQIHRLPELVGELERAGGRIVETGFCDRVRSLDIPAQPAAGAVSTFVTIMQGCNNFCAYCVVPHLRGREESRPLPEIVREVETLARPRHPGGDASGAERELLWADAAEGHGFYRADRRHRKGPRDRENPLYHLPSEGSVAATDRLLRGSGLPLRTYPPAGAVGIGPGAQADEPGLYGRGLPGEGRRAPAGLSGDQHHVRCDRGIPRGRGGGLSGDVGADAGSPV